jgi:hypothetical protein
MTTPPMTNLRTGVRNTISDTIECPRSSSRKQRNDAAYCCRKHQKNAIRKTKTDKHELEFVCIDGEGETDAFRQHKYVLLGASNRTGYHRSIENKAGLQWNEIFNFLWECFKEKPEAVFAGFFLGYDFAQWFKSFPEAKARLLFTKEGRLIQLLKARKRKPENRYPLPIRIEGYRVSNIGERMIRIQKINDPVRSEKNGRPEWLYINDSGPFFQSSLLNVIDPEKWDDPVVTQEEFEKIKEGKENRSTATLDDNMRYYNRLENDILSRVLERYNAGLVQQEIRLNRANWYGPGRAASEWLKYIGAPTRDEVSDALKNALPGVDLWEIAVSSYIAGWFEIMCHGHVKGTSYEYDINSAYPSVMATLPCLLHGKWTAGMGCPPHRPKSYTLCRARVYGKDQYIGSMLHRSKDGNRLCRPSNTSGIYWLHELQAAQRAGLIDTIQTIEWWSYSPCSCQPPLADIKRLYEHRLSINKDSAEGKACKLIYNSAYGKCAQSVGSPRFANPIYASLITAGCRIKILSAIANHPFGSHDVLMVATDAVFFFRKHPTLALSEKLGEWGLTKRENLTLFKPGHYWDDAARNAIAANRSPKFKARGVNARSFANSISRIDEQFSEWDRVSFVDRRYDGPVSKDGWSTLYILEAHGRRLPTNFIEWPMTKYPMQFSMVTIGQALQWNKWEMCGKVEGDKIVGPIKSDPWYKRSYPRKRWEMETETYEGNYKLYRSYPHPWAFRRTHDSKTQRREGSAYSSFELSNTGYSRSFGLEREEDEIRSLSVTPDGPIDILAMDALGLGKLRSGRGYE